MKIHIVTEQQDPEADDYDALLPYLARAQEQSIEARGGTPAEAAATVKGICLHWLGEWDDPPSEVEFMVGPVTG